VVTNLPPGVYDFTVAYTGFATVENRGVTLLVDQVATLDFSLKPGATKQEVSITAQAPLVNFTNATVGEVVGSQEVVQLPLNGRQFTQLILLTPGASPMGTGQQSFFDFRSDLGAISPAVNGMRAEQNNFTIDGVENNELFFGFVAVNPPPDAIQEFKVQTDISSGEYGRGAGANVNVVTKSGTNEWHGDAWEFLRNTSLNARNFFNTDVSAFHQNQFGGTLGGPIRKNKVWGFGWYEGFRKTLGETSLAQVPTAAQLSGDLSAFAPIFNPFSTTQTGTDAQGNPIFTRQPFTGNQISSSLLDPTSLAVAKLLYPAPNYVGQSGINYLNTQSGVTYDNQVGVRVDAALTQSTNVFGRFTWDKGDRMLPSNLPEAAVYTVGHDVQQVLGLTHIFNPTTVLDLHAQFLRTYLARDVTPPTSASFLQTNGITQDWPPNTGLPPLFPSASISDITGLSATSLSPAGAPINHWQYSGSLSKIAGSHTINAGASLIHTWVLDNCTYASGSFDSVPTSDPQNPTTTGSGLASFLLGVPSAATRWAGSAIMTYKGNYYGAYLDDVWKVTPKLTVTLAVRYDYVTPFVETEGRASGLDFEKSTPTKTVWFLQRGAHPTLVNLAQSPITIEPVDSIFFPQRKDWSPRIGTAYRLGDNFVIRSGFGIFYDFGQAISLNTQEIMGQWPFGFADATPGDLNLPTSSHPTPQHIFGVNVFPPFVPPLVPDPGIGNSDYRNQPYPYVEEWNLMLDKNLAGC
jgi:hypothetical protein